MKQTFLMAALALAAMPLMAQSAKAPKPPAPPHAYVFETDSASGNSSYLGVEINDISSDRAQALKLKDDRGVEVTEVDEDAPAGKAGLKEHDVILGFNGTPVQSAEQFKRLMRETPAGRTVTLDVSRDGQPKDLKVTLADRGKYMPKIATGNLPKVWSFEAPDMPIPPMPAMPDFPRMWNETTITRVYRSIAGITIENLSPQLGDYFGVKNGEGMLVRSVQKGSPADTAGLRAGDVIVRVDDQKIADHSDWTEALRNAKNGKANVVIVRDKHEQTLPLAVAPRRGRDSSALNDEDFPDIEAAMDSAADALDSVEPAVEESASIATTEAAKALELSQKQVAQAMSKGCKEAQRQLAANRGEIDRQIRQAMKQASNGMRAYGPELQKAMQELQQELQHMQIDLDDMH
jgi:serine protease Do